MGRQRRHVRRSKYGIPFVAGRKIIISEKELETKAINFLGDEDMAKDFVKYIKEKK